MLISSVILLLIAVVIIFVCDKTRKKELLAIEATLDLVIQNYEDRLVKMTEEHSTLLSQKKSSEVRLGQISEHFAPLLEDFPYDPKGARFLGSPIDFVVFEEDRIVFVEFKTGMAQQTSKQRNVKALVEAGKVCYAVMRVNKNVTVKESVCQQVTD